MGCDIHLFVEKYDSENEQWVGVNDTAPDEWVIKWRRENPDRYPSDGVYSWEVGRNYDLFAILADVRNGVGFAGIKTGGGFNPIDYPRGLPDDTDPRIREESDGWGEDGHSHSYFTVRELLEYDWDQVTAHQGVVGAKQFLVFKEKGSPDSWSGSISGPNIKHISNEEMEKGIADGTIEVPDDGNGWNVGTYYTLVEWEEPYKVSVQYFLKTFLPKVQTLGNPDDVRLVFWFDN